MTAAMMSPPPEEGPDPLAPEHVTPLVVYLAGPEAEGVNGEVFVVHGGVIAVLEPPRLREVFHAAEHGSADGMWTPEAVRGALDPYRDRAPEVGFFCGDTMELATETIGFL